MFFLWAQYYDTMANIVSEQYISIAAILVPLALGGGGVAALWRWYKTRPSDKNFAKFYREVFDIQLLLIILNMKLESPVVRNFFFKIFGKIRKGQCIRFRRRKKAYSS